MRGPIVLVGLMGSGKTSVGAALAKRLGWPHVDLDQALEKRWSQSIPDQFSRVGEAGFRRRETAQLARELRRRCVLSTGGGVVTQEPNRRALKGHCTVFLQASPATLAARLTGAQAAKRPLLKGKSPVEVLRRLQRVRGPWYREVASVTVRAGQGGPGQVAERILRRCGQLG
ncbi:MAG TPA: shikimate kinase [bacterium]|jgi:shikimate kinase|nr:shikimate kinase [bacterium]